MTPIRVAVLRSGDNTGVNFCLSLARAGGYLTLGVDWTVPEHLASQADERFLEPELATGGPETIRACVERLGADLLYVADTCPQLTLVSAHRAKIGAPVFLPDAADHDRMEDKWLTFLALAAAGVRVPESILPETAAEVRAFAEAKGSVWLRRRRGSGGAGSLSTADPSLACAWVDAAGGWQEFTVAERLTERSSTFSAVWNAGELVASQLRDRLGWKYGGATPTGISGITGLQRTRGRDELHELAVAAVRAVARVPNGIIGVDFTFGRDGLPYVTEVQPARFFSSIDFLTRAGLNLPNIYCKTALELPMLRAPALNPLAPGWHWLKNVDLPPLLLTPAEAAAYGL